MTAPTEGEIRQAIDTEFDGADWTESYWNCVMDAYRALWDVGEFRKTEMEQFDAIMLAGSDAIQRTADAAGIAEALRAFRRVAAELPDLPRKVAVPA